MKKIREFSDKLVKKSLELGGTATGEHGIGLNKKKYLEIEHKNSLFLMKKIKKSIDPENIMNPGKIFDTWLKLLKIYYCTKRNHSLKL